MQASLYHIFFKMLVVWATAKFIAPPWVWLPAAEKQKTLDCAPWSTACPKTKNIFLTEEKDGFSFPVDLYFSS